LNRKIISIALVAFVVLVATAGCGSSSDSSADSTSSLTKAALIKQGDAICKKGDDGIATALQAFLAKKHLSPEKPMTPALEKEALNTVALPSLQKQAEEIAALGAPSGDEAEVSAIVEGLETAVKEGEEDPLSLNAPSGKARNSLVEVNKLAQEYGFKVCGQNF
jgi:maltose-binding protein MalE